MNYLKGLKPLCLKGLLILILATLSAHSQFTITASPQVKGAAGLYGYQSSFISGSCTTHVTSISLNQYSFFTGGLYGFQVNGLGQRVPSQWGSSGHSTISLSATQRVTTITVWTSKDCCQLWIDQIQFALNDVTTQTVNYAGTGGDTVHVFTIPTGYEFVGFKGISATTGWEEMLVYISCATDASTGITFDLSNINGKFQIVNSGATTSLSFTITDTTGGACGAIVYSVTVSPAFATPSLITIPNTGTAAVQFLASTNTADTKTYTLTVSAYYSGSIPCPASATATYTYKDQCFGAILSWASTITALQTSILVQDSLGNNFIATTAAPQISDSVSIAQGTTGICGSIVFSLSSVPATTVVSLSVTELYINSATGIVSVWTANTATIGVHSVTITATLASFPSVSSFIQFTLTIQPCIVTSLKVIQSSPLGELQQQTYTLSFTAILTYQLTIVQTPACGYSSSLWSVSASIGPMPANFQNIGTSTGLYTVGPTPNLDQIGTYTISITSVTVNSVIYGAAPNPLVFPSTFDLLVVDPCFGSNLIPPATSLLDMTISDLIQVQPGGNSKSITQQVSQIQDTVSILYGDLTGLQYCGPRQYSITSVKTTASYPLSSVELSIDSSTGLITLFSLSNQNVGTHTATVVSSLTKYSSVLITLPSFTITITPCIVTSVKVVQLADLRELSPMTLTIGQKEQFNVPLTTKQTPACGYSSSGWSVSAQNVQSPGILDNINQNSGVYTVSPFQSSLKSGNYTISVTSVEVNGIRYDGSSQLKTLEEPSQFQLLVKGEDKTIILSRRPPYFEKPLHNQNVSQCPGQTQTLWSFIIPKITDPNLRQVSVQVSLNSTIFDFDNQSLEIKQKTVGQKPINEIISITLSNELNISATYPMRVQFSCTQVSNWKFEDPFKVFLEALAKQTVWPNAYIKLIEPNGLMHVKFYSKMKVPSSPEEIKTGSITLNDTLFPNLLLQIVPGKYSDTHFLRFNWSVVNFTSQYLLLQLDFENKTYVSSNDASKDSIVLTIYGFQYFTDLSANYMVPGLSLRQKVLPQMDAARNLQIASQKALTSKLIVQTTIIVTTVASFFVYGPFKVLLDSVKQLQIMVHIMLIDLAFPITITVQFGALMNVLTFQYYDFTQIFNHIFSLDPDSVGENPINNQFNFMGYTYLYITLNFGTLCWTFFCVPIAYVVLNLLSIFSPRKLNYYKIKVGRLMFIDYWLSFIDESYLFLAVCVGLNLFNLQWQNYGDSVNSVIAILLGFIVLAYPLFVVLFYSTPSNYLLVKSKQENFFSRFGTILQGLNFKNSGRLVLIYSFFRTFRKLWLAYILVFRINHGVSNIFQIIFNAFLMILVASQTKPMTEVRENRMILVNEALFLLFSYHLFHFTDYLRDLTVRSIVGQSLVIVLMVSITLNLGSVWLLTLQATAKKIKYCRLRHKQRLRIKLRRSIFKQLSEKNLRQLERARILSQQAELRRMQVAAECDENLPDSFSFFLQLVQVKSKILQHELPVQQQSRSQSTNSQKQLIDGPIVLKAKRIIESKIQDQRNELTETQNDRQFVAAKVKPNENIFGESLKNQLRAASQSPTVENNKRGSIEEQKVQDQLKKILSKGENQAKRPPNQRRESSFKKQLVFTQAQPSQNLAKSNHVSLTQGRSKLPATENKRKIVEPVKKHTSPAPRQNQTELITLATYLQKRTQKKIEVQEVIQKGAVKRYNVLCQGVVVQTYQISVFDDYKQIAFQMKAANKYALEMANDLPQPIQAIRGTEYLSQQKFF